jgi:hypothetical protein
MTPHWTPIEYVTSAVGIVLVSNPVWMTPETEWHLHLQITSLILGCVLLIFQIAIKASDWWQRRKRKKENVGKNIRQIRKR